MTPFERWAKTAKDFSSEVVWKAACAYQKEQDAKLCEAEKVDIFIGDYKKAYNLAIEACVEAISEQGEAE